LDLLKSCVDCTESDLASFLRIGKLEGHSKLVSGSGFLIFMEISGMAISVSVADEQLEFSPGSIEFAVFS
jgi:hypothetical protein